LLNFDSSLSNALTTHATNAFWVLKLYYNDESSFYGVSDQDRTDGSDVYYGIVSSWGSLNQSLDFFNFTTSTGNMSVKLINTDNTIEGGRFSDLFSTYNFANRKWELFLNTDRAGTYDTSARMIGSGIISGDISYDTKSISLKLLDYSSTYHKQLPTNVVDSATYTNAPEKNINKPIPMAYGDFYEKAGIGTIPTTYFDRFKNFYKGAFPAIVTDKYNNTDTKAHAVADSQALHTMDAENIYIHKDPYYPTLKGSIDVSLNPTIKYSGSSASVYIPYSSSGSSTTDSGNASTTARNSAVDGDFSASATLDSKGAIVPNSYTTNFFAIPQTDSLGDYTSIEAILKFGTVSGTFDSANTLYIGGEIVTPTNIVSNAAIKESIAGAYSSDETDNWDFQKQIQHKLLTADQSCIIGIAESGVQIGFVIKEVSPHRFGELYEELRGDAIGVHYDKENQTVNSTTIRSRTKTANIPSISDYIYYSGKGRKYGSWISDGGRSVGYATTDFIENPVFVIEDILRTELSLTDSEIDETSFDTSGNYDSVTPANDGHLKLIYGEDKMIDIKYAFSQYKFINSKDLISRLCKQILSWVFIGGDGKFKIKTLRRSYSSVDKTIDFNDISLKNISRTSLGAVRNDITINYNHDYGQNQFISNATATDATSKGTTVDGFNVSGGLKLEMDADTLDSTTASQLADAYMTIFKDRKIMLNFDCLRPTYNDLEIGDIVKFSNWDTTIKLYGTAMGTDYYIISSISKKPNGCSVKAIKVS
jgi:hypothetical protein